MDLKFLKEAALTCASMILLFTVSGEAQEKAQTVNRTEDVQRRLLEERAIEAVIWGMPLVSQNAQHQASLRDAGAKDNDIVFWSQPSGWKNQTTTPNASVRYVFVNYNTKSEGPVVLEIPAAVGAGLFGTIVDAWQVPLLDLGPSGEDQGKGGKFLILPPDFKGEVPAGYFPVRSETNNGFVGFRAISRTEGAEDVAKALALVKQTRVYPLSKATNPPEQRFVDIYGKLYDGIVRFDGSYFVNLAKMVNEEPVLARDKEMMGLILTLGIEKDKEFKPDAAMQATLKAAAQATHAWFMQSLLTFGVQFWPDRKWIVPVSPVGPQTGFKWETANYFDLDARGIAFFSFNTPPAKLGAATFYLAAYVDGQGAKLRGENTYRLHVPPNVPAKQFWAVTLYDLETCSFIRDVMHVGLDSYDQKMHRNPDGSVDLCFGSKAPAGLEANWIPTVPSRGYFPWFRFYEPDKPLFEKSWLLPDIELLKQ
jgi:hypothetical protein